MKNVNHLIVATLNINSIRYKFDQLKFLIQDKIDILVLQETKIDHTFPLNQFIIEGYSPPFRRDRTCMGGGIMVYVRENVSAKILNISETIEGILNLGTRLWIQIPNFIQETDTLGKFKEYMKKWRPTKCPCDICKEYIYGVGYARVCKCQSCCT